jgi:hypothetical protein
MQASAAGSLLTFNYSQLAGILGIVATSAIASVFTTLVFRLSKLRVWGPVVVAGTPVFTSVTWLETSNDFESPPITKSDSSISFDHPAFIDAKPPRGSLASKWHGSGQVDNLFTLTFPVGAIFDFDFEFVMNDLGAPLAGPVIAGGTLGQFYHKGTNNLIAVAVNAI